MKFEIDLTENPSAGYIWESVPPADEISYPPHMEGEEMSYGGETVATHIFNDIPEGKETDIIFNYQRLWLGSVETAQVIRVRLGGEPTPPVHIEEVGEPDIRLNIVTTAPYFPPHDDAPCSYHQQVMKELISFLPDTLTQHMGATRDMVGSIEVKFEKHSGTPNGILVDVDFGNFPFNEEYKQHLCTHLLIDLQGWKRRNGLEELDIRMTPYC